LNTTFELVPRERTHTAKSHNAEQRSQFTTLVTGNGGSPLVAEKNAQSAITIKVINHK
jgi:hypothetical protein